MIKHLHYHIKLSKFYLSIAVAFSAIIGYVIFNVFSLIEAMKLFCGVLLLSSGASALNQVIECKKDVLMKRTASRPVASGKISIRYAIISATIYALSGALILYTQSSTAMFLGVFNLILYAFVYTPLKYSSYFALIIGGIVGAVPPLIGWYASGTHNLNISIIIFTSFMFMWQIPHFFILFLKYSNEYEVIGVISIIQKLQLLQKKIILLIWFVGTSLLSLLFPLVGIIELKPLILLLIAINSLILIFIIIVLINWKKTSLKIANAFIHIYLLLNFALICVDKALT